MSDKHGHIGHCLLAAEYLRTSVVKGADQVVRHLPFEVLRHPELLARLGRALSDLIYADDYDVVCILASSGLAIGIATAELLGKSICVYRDTGWDIDDDRVHHSIYPVPKTGSRVLVIDSHINTGASARQCIDILHNLQCKAKSVAVLVDLRAPNLPERIGIPTIALCRADEMRDELFELLSISKDSDLAGALMGAKSASRQVTGRDEKTRLPPSAYLQHSLHPRSFGADYDQLFGESLRRQFQSGEGDLWRFLCSTLESRPTIARAASFVDFASVRLTACTDYLGTIFGLRMALAVNYRGQMLSTLSYQCWPATIGTDTNVRPQVISARLRSGLHVYAASERLKTLGAETSRAVILRRATKSVLTPRLVFLTELSRQGVEVVILS